MNHNELNALTHEVAVNVACRKFDDQRAFEAAEIYDATGDTECLTHENEREALWEELERQWEAIEGVEGGETIRQTIARIAPVEVTAWKSKELGKDMADRFAERWIDNLHDHEGEEDDHWIENYGNWEDSDGGPIGSTTPEEREEIADAVSKALHPFLVKHAKVYRCEQVAVRSYTEEGLLELFKTEIKEEEERRKP